MILPNVLADRIESFVQENAEKYCLDCLDKIPKSQCDCEHCQRGNVGLLLWNHSAFKTSDMFDMILDDVTKMIRPVGKSTGSLEDELNASNDFFTYNEMVYRTEDAIEVIGVNEYRMVG
jgi:hypothetical protein